MKIDFKWTVYMVRCWTRDRRAPATFYTGITTNVQKRFEDHRTGKGAKYTKGRIVDAYVVLTAGLTRSAALRFEAKVKRLSHDQKMGYWERDDAGV